MSTLNAKVILNVKTAAEWANSMEILLEGELGIESDTRLIKIGNGVDTYISLPYTAASDINDIEGVTVTNPTDGNVLTYSNGEWVNITPSALPADTDLSHYDNSTSGFITASDIPALPADTDLSQYDNTTSDFATVSQIPTDVSQLNNDAGYITSASVPSVGDGTITIQKNSVNVDSFTTNQSGNTTINLTVPTLLSELTNDVGYITNATIPTVNDATLTIQQNGTDLGTFTANASIDSTVDIIVPTKTSDLNNDSGFITASSIPTVGSGNLILQQNGNVLATFSANASSDVTANITVGTLTSLLTVDSSLIPDTDYTYNLGSSSYKWNTLYVCNIYGGGSSIEIDGNVYPKTDVTDALGGSSNRWREIYGKELYISDSITLNGTTYTSMLPLSGGEMTGDITVSGSHTLGTSGNSWSSGYIDSVYATNIKLTGALTVGIPSDALAYKRIAIKGYDGNTEGTLTNWAWLGWVNTGVFGFRPVTSDTGTIGTTSEFWNKGYFTNLCTTGIYSKYDPNTQISNVGLFYNTHVIEVTPAVQWGYMGQKSASEIGIFPLVGNTYLGSSTTYWSGVYSTHVTLSSNVFLQTTAGGQVGEFYWYNDTDNESAALQLVGNCIRAYSGGQAGKINLGNQYGAWNALYINDATYFLVSHTTMASVRLQSDGNFLIKKSSFGTTDRLMCMNDTGGVYLTAGATSWTANSDIRLKENVEPIKTALDDIMHLNPIKYSLKDHKLTYADRAGFIAQEVQKYIPEVVVGVETDTEYLGLSYTELTPFIVRAIQELSSKVDELNAKIKVLEGRA